MDQNEMNSSECYLEQLYLLSPDMLCVAGVDGFFKHVNPSFERTLGHSRQQLLSVPFADFVHPEDRDATFQELSRLAEGNDTVQFENRYRCKNGDYKWLSWTVAPDRDAILVYATARDITEMKLIAARLSQVQRLESIGSLAGGIAHDLNNIFSPVLMAAELLPTLNPDADEDSQRLFRVLESNARHGSRLVEKIVNFAKGQSSERRPIDFPKLLSDLQHMVPGSFPVAIPMEIDVADNLPLVLGDSSRLYQVLLNLCVNARDAMPTSGRLCIKVSAESIDETFARLNLASAAGDYVVIRVSDTGVGISEELQEKIFEPFYSTKDSENGSGLGLATVLSIVKSHDGFVTCDSEVGNGTTFAVYLPVAKD